MIYLQDYDETLKELGKEFFIFDMLYVSDLPAWAKENRADLNEPLQPMKLITRDGSGLQMAIQSEISEEALNDIVNGLDVRWSLMDNAANVAERLNSVKKRLAYCLLKECARTGRDIDDELQADEWAVEEMEKLGFFNE